MRNVSTSVFFLALAGLGFSAIVACSADGSTDIPGDTSAIDAGNQTTGDDGGTNNADIPTGSGGDSYDAGPSHGNDSGAKTATDSGTSGSPGFDAGPPAPNAGDACKTIAEEFTRSCGFCGTQSAICIAGDGGTVVSDYSDCMGEVANGCTPGTTTTEACGLCGTHQLICQNSCQYAAGTCMGEPLNACSPGTVLNTAAGCGKDTGGEQQYRQEICDTTCKLGAPTTCGIFVNPHVLAIAGTAKGVVSTAVDMEVTKGQSFIMDGFASCPDMDTTDLTDDAPSDYVEVDNNTAKTASVTAFTTPFKVGDDYSTNIWTYSGSVPPLTDAARIACNVGVSEFCATSTLCGPDSDDFFASQNLISIPAGGKVLVYVGSYDASTTAK